MAFLNLFSRKRRGQGDFFPFQTDMHSHILPGIDDGSPDIKTSLELIRGLMKLGVRRSVATPHVIGDMYRNTPDSIHGALKVLQEAIRTEGLDYEVTAAAEYMLDAYFLDLLADKKVLLTVSGNLLLTEFSYSTMPTNPERMSFAIITEGFTPILAHPERYAYYYRNFKEYNRLKELGFMLQVNVLSLTGYYGKEALKAARYMLKNDLVSFLGTDLHHANHMAALSNPRNQDLFREALSGREWNVL
jgi:hypothetical protein